MCRLKLLPSTKVVHIQLTNCKNRSRPYITQWLYRRERREQAPILRGETRPRCSYRMTAILTMQIKMMDMMIKCGLSRRDGSRCQSGSKTRLSLARNQAVLKAVWTVVKDNSWIEGLGPNVDLRRRESNQQSNHKLIKGSIQPKLLNQKLILRCIINWESPPMIHLKSFAAPYFKEHLFPKKLKMLIMQKIE